MFRWKAFKFWNEIQIWNTGALFRHKLEECLKWLPLGYGIFNYHSLDRMSVVHVHLWQGTWQCGRHEITCIIALVRHCHSSGMNMCWPGGFKKSAVVALLLITKEMIEYITMPACLQICMNDKHLNIQCLSFMHIWGHGDNKKSLGIINPSVYISIIFPLIILINLIMIVA